VIFDFELPPLVLPESLLRDPIIRMERVNKRISEKQSSIGTGSEVFKKAKNEIELSLKRGISLIATIKTKIHVRAFASVLLGDTGRDVKLNDKLLKHLSSITPIPGSLLIESIQRYYFNNYVILKTKGLLEAICDWLLWAFKVKGRLTPAASKMFSPLAAKWLAESAVKRNTDFENRLESLDLTIYKGGELIGLAQNIYFVKQLEVIEVNKPHDILKEVQKQSVYNSPYQGDELLGHEILRVLLKRAPARDVDDSWLNVVMAIAGDPRVPKSHPSFIKWWSQMPKSYLSKMHGWLSRLDLRLFLKALEDHAKTGGDEKLKRMYPSRKTFLYALDDKKLVLKTRLFLSRSAEAYLLNNFKKEHLPTYSRVAGGGKNISLIYVELDGAHIVEGTHDCAMRIFNNLHESAPVFNYDNSSFPYRELTKGLEERMEELGCGFAENIQHNPSNFNWQKKAVSQLKRQRVDIEIGDVLSMKDYKMYKAGGNPVIL
jgi:hypothetical protein